MSKGKKLNPLDELITKLGEQFSKIPNFSQVINDKVLYKVHMFIAIRTLQLHSTKDLIVKSFLPSVNSDILKTQQYVKTSIYKDLLDVVDYEIDDIKYETIRLGYVLAFHKYENFVKDLIGLWEEISIETTKETNQTLVGFLKTKFNISLTSWHEFPSVHMFSYISNCTKHADGISRLDNPKHKKPDYFYYANDGEPIKPTIKNYKDDFERLMKSLEIMISIIGYCNLFRVLEANNNATYEYNGERIPLYSEESKIELNLELSKLFTHMSSMIEIYKEL